jgi:hypothetical protein
MSQLLTTDFVTTPIPGAYVKPNVISLPVGAGASGVIVIIGEADGGPSYQSVVLKNNSFTPDQLSNVAQAYISGPIVDAMSALAAPSADPAIQATANTVYIVKTNTGTQASALVDTNYGKFQDKNYGLPGNKYKFTITQLQSEVAPTITGTAIPAFGAPLNGCSFSIRLNGGVASVVTLGSVSANHSSAATLATELNSLLPSGIAASAGTVTGTIVLTMAADANANHIGYGKSFELIDSTSGDLAALGLSAGLTVSSEEPEVEVSIVRADTGVNETIDVQAEIAMTVGYNGTTGTLTINQAAGTLTTTVTGGSGANLSLKLSAYSTVADLAAYINSQTGYSASVIAQAQQSAPSVLDSVSAIGIASATGQPGRIKDAASSFAGAVGNSTVLTFTPQATAGLPNVQAATYLAGGLRGGTLAADVVAAIAQLAGIQCNILVPLFSQDASKDIAAGVTDSSSTYTIDAINLAVKNHCLQYSTPKLKRNRIAVLSNLDTYDNAKARAQALADFRISFTFQSTQQLNSAGVVTTFQPWYAAVVAAGMQAGGFYQSITNKIANVSSVIDPVGFDSGSPGDVEDALDGGMLILQSLNAGVTWVSDQTTYGLDTNFVYNSMQAVYCSDILEIDLAQSFQQAFVGKSLADVNAAIALSFLGQKMDAYRKQKLIGASSDAPLGFKNAKVDIQAPTMSVSVEVKLATAVYFIPINFNISQITQSAG